ncbi:MAG TPA: HlyD family secretion protein [Bryobacteraceae bacterium]|nr:HlyD family secretion protein [Bryobacteraceae bacterium]
MADLAPAPQKREAAIRRKPATRRRLWVRLALLAVILSGLGIGGYRLWGYLGTYESTDDAQVDGHILAVSARISGHVADVPVEDARYVNAGDVLLRIDPTDYEAALAQASADLANAEAALESSRTGVPITSVTTRSQLNSARSSRAGAEAALASAERQLNAARARVETAQAQVRETEADYKRATDDVARYRKLIDKDEIPAQQYDTAVAVADAAKATVDARRAAVDEARQNITVAEAAVEQANTRIAEADATIESALTAPQQVAVSRARAKAAEALVEQKRAALRQAQLNLSYCVIRAPFSGIIGKKTVEVGNNISPGQQLMALVPLDDIWVTANFKETQLRGMKPGDKVKFTVDAYGRAYTGKLEAVGGAAGSRFSLLPPENATGNYVKVVQRIPVRIDIDPGQNADHRLRPGMSAVPSVYVR